MNRELLKIIDKEVISIKEFHKITNSEDVMEITASTRKDGRYDELPRYDVRLQNGELHFVYVKINSFMLG